MEKVLSNSNIVSFGTLEIKSKINVENDGKINIENDGKINIENDSTSFGGVTPLSKGRLYIFIASHFTKSKRLDLFKQLLNSINQQTTKLQQIYLSFSTEDKSTKKEIDKIIGNYSTLVHTFHQPNKLSQFEHFLFLTLALGNIISDNDWIGFSDDDDLWNDRRIECMQSGISRLESNNVIKLSDYDVFDGKTKTKGTGEEYWQMMVKYPILKKFFADTTIPFIKHSGCDLKFIHYLKSNYEIIVLATHTSMYIYRRHENSECNKIKRNEKYIQPLMEELNKTCQGKDCLSIISKFVENKESKNSLRDILTWLTQVIDFNILIHGRECNVDNIMKNFEVQYCEPLLPKYRPLMKKQLEIICNTGLPIILKNYL